jgi:hypothetical protein
VTCRSTRASLSADGARGGKPSTFVVLTSGSDDAHAVVVVTEYVSHQSERSGMQHVHRLRLRTEVPARDGGALHSLRLTNPALAGSLAVLQTLRSCSATIRATPWLARFLLGTARAAELVALQSVEDRAGDARFVLGMGVFASAAALSDCIGQAQTLARDDVQISLSTADPQRCVSLQVESAAPLEIELSGGGGGAHFRPYAAQQEALLSALTRRLTLVIGPPGTGKTDTAVLMIVAMLGRFRGARLLVSAVSNLALDQLIDKLVAFAPAAVLLRLGGQTQLDVARRFTVDGIAAARSRALCAPLHELRARGAWRRRKRRHFVRHARAALDVDASTERGRRQWRGDGRARRRGDSSAASGARMRGVNLWRRRRLRGALARALPDHAAATLAEMRAIGELLALSHVQREVALMRGCSLVFATTTGMAMRHRRLREGGIAFPLVMMEEAAKVLETEALTCFAHGVERIVLIGDHSAAAAARCRRLAAQRQRQLLAVAVRAPLARRRGGNHAQSPGSRRARHRRSLSLPLRQSARFAGGARHDDALAAARRGQLCRRRRWPLQEREQCGRE